ncbi:MAG: KUP/HAK/KT family potassium transporter [Bryobacteraceae bacterium]|nr:KUP/HAK/KT family potassium transporter [Bryobacteraceae bacterium]
MADSHATEESGHHTGSFAALALAALGVVFGDIGTSPLYTLKECLHAVGHETGHAAGREDLFGLLSLIFWAMTMVVFVKYLTFVMKADNKGEGGIFALLALAPRQMRAGKPGHIPLVALLAVAGAALLYGDGMITPAISVLSAVEGLQVANPDLQAYVVPLTVLILLGLFAIQSHGTAMVGKLFGPVMVVWFATLATLGLYHVSHDPQILAAMFPTHAIDYFARHGWGGVHILASVVLAVTGGEALYADMGHFGIRPIRWMWVGLVMPSLLLAYFGQGAHALRHPETFANPFFSMVPTGAATYALAILSSLATVIASQALISGAFSLTWSAMQLGYFPRVQVKHTAHDAQGQIYIPQMNFFLAVGCILLVLMFRESTKLAAAYGLAVTGTMVFTTLIYYVVIRDSWGWPLSRALPLLILFLATDLPFLWANLFKLFDGGYVPLLIGAAVMTVMVLWNRGRTLIAHKYHVRFPTPESAKKRVDARLISRVPGTAVFMASSADMLPPVLVHHVERSRTLQETVILLTVQTANSPIVPARERFTVSPAQDGFFRLIIRYGFMQEPLVPEVLRQAVQEAGIPFSENEVTYYLGRESFVASKRGRMGVVSETIFAFLQRNAVTVDRHFGLPYRQVVEIGTQMDL